MSVSTSIILSHTHHHTIIYVSVSVCVFVCVPIIISITIAIPVSVSIFATQHIPMSVSVSICTYVLSLCSSTIVPVSIVSAHAIWAYTHLNYYIYLFTIHPTLPTHPTHSILSLSLSLTPTAYLPHCHIQYRTMFQQ